MTVKIKSRRKGEYGNAFFMVMIGVVLFGALMFTFSRGVRQGGSNLSEKQIEIAATELINTAQRYKRSMDRMRMKGCSESQISFASAGTGILIDESGTDYVYTNPNSPGDGSCHMFHPDGGNIRPALLPEDYVIDNSLVCAGCLHSRSLLFSSLRVSELERDSGTDGSELVMWMGRVTRNICAEINDQLGIPNPGGNPPVDTWACDSSDAPYTGTPDNCTNPIGDTVTELAGRESFCVAFDGSGWTYIFMNVLIPR